MPARRGLYIWRVCRGRLVALRGSGLDEGEALLKRRVVANGREQLQAEDECKW